MIDIGGYRFNGPYVLTKEKLEEIWIWNRAGVYVILGKVGEESKYNEIVYEIVYVGQSRYIGERIKNHHAEKCWIQQKKLKNYSILKMAINYKINKNSRLQIEKNIIDEYSPKCNKKNMI